ncbi:MAG: 5'/3'-nucleotidase SurE [Planctomycetota bacterium]|nr:5'/3'-nucleotidase SurE [Planctomycetota bacterium]
MRILLTNDDGIRAPGIGAMYEALIDLHRRHGGMPRVPDEASRAPRDVVHVIAPLTVQSATSHGVTYHTPLMVGEETVELAGSAKFEGLSVDGRPADCVKLAIANLWPERFGEGSRPDLVVSGMNDGANVGVNVIYSGTVAAAIEAAFLGVPSIACSMIRGRGKANYEVGAAWCRAAIDRILAGGLPRPHECLSVNVPATDGSGPAVDAGKVPPIRVCPMNTHGLVDKYERRVSPAGGAYYWAAGHGLDFMGTDAGSDVDELLRGCITVTPLKFDLTRGETLAAWRGRLEG